MQFFINFYENVVISNSPRSLLIIAGISILIYRIPVIDKVLRTFHTLIHETGHSIAAFLTSGTTHRIELYHNLSGITVTESSSKLQQSIISLSGYFFASLFAYISFLMIESNLLKVYLIALSGIIFLQLLLNIRNFYGIIWSLSSLIILMYVIFFQIQLAFAFSVMISSIILFDSVLASGWILILSINKSSKSGDAYNLQKTTSIPAFFWGLVFFAQALFFFYLVLIKLELENTLLVNF